MKKVIAMGVQDYAKLKEYDRFYIDKTRFISDWWQSGDRVTLIARPQGFGKTLNLTTVECFFSSRYAGRSDLFSDMQVWESEEMRGAQGAYPVIFLSFAGAVTSKYTTFWHLIRKFILRKFSDLEIYRQKDRFSAEQLEALGGIGSDMSEEETVKALKLLSGLLETICHRKALILLDDYDSPLREAGDFRYKEEAEAFLQRLMYHTFEDNPSLERGLIVGMTYHDGKTVLSGIHDLEVIGHTSEKYDDFFGFTEPEVFKALSGQDTENLRGRQ